MKRREAPSNFGSQIIVREHLPRELKDRIAEIEQRYQGAQKTILTPTVWSWHEWPWPGRHMLHSERIAFARMGKPRRVVHHVIRLATAPRLLWPLWRLYRQTWPR